MYNVYNHYFSPLPSSSKNFSKCSPQKNTPKPLSNPCPSHLSALGITVLCPVSKVFLSLDISCKRKLTPCECSSLSPLTEHNVLGVHTAAVFIFSGNCTLSFEFWPSLGWWWRTLDAGQGQTPHYPKVTRADSPHTCCHSVQTATLIFTFSKVFNKSHELFNSLLWNRL